MTALNEYERLECTGLWKESFTSQRQEVLILFGENSLILRNSAGMAVSHWSLPAIQRINKLEHPALYRPGKESVETLEIDDRIMIDAISKITKIIDQRRPKHGKIRMYILVSIIIFLLTFSIIWIPQRLVEHTLAVTLETNKLALGRSLLKEISKLSGTPCKSKLGDAALINLKKRLLGESNHTLVIVPDSRKKVFSLPGNIHVIDKTVLEDHDTPEVAAGYIYSAIARTENSQPFESFIRTARTSTILRFLITSKIKDDVLQKYAEKMLIHPNLKVKYPYLLKKFQNKIVSTKPFAYAIDVTGDTTSLLIDGDPYLGKSPPLLIPDSMWLSLQKICE